KIQAFLKRLEFKYFLIPFVVFGLLVAGVVLAQQTGFFKVNTVFPKGVEYVSDQILVKYKAGQSPEELTSAGKTAQEKILATSLTAIGVTSQQRLFSLQNNGLENYYLLSLKKGLSIPAVYAALTAIPEIENATPDYILKIQETPNDPYFPQMWNLSKINMAKAWSITHTHNVTVAVIDTGVDYNHSDLAGAVIKGENFITGSLDPMDDQGHGTHVAGIIGAVTNNANGVSGVSWGAKILAIKACDNDGNCNTTNVSRAIAYAVDNGAKIINISIAGSGTCNGTYTDMVNYAKQKGVLMVTAAGNGTNGDGVGVSADTQIPSSCAGVLSVGAVDVSSSRSSFSNYGSHVQIAAPGGLGPCSIPTCILSTGLDNGYTLRAGTSMAAPHVSGVAALLLSVNSKLSIDKIKSCLIQGGDKIQTDKPMGPLLNPSKALVLCSGVAAKPTPSPAFGASPTIAPNIAGSISGTVFVDKNGDQRYESGESVFPGAQVVLSGLKSDSVISNTKGKYVFPNLPSGLYTISLTVNGQSVGTPIDVTLVSDTSSVLLDLPVPSTLVIPTPTVPVQKTASGCYIDPACLSKKGSFQICSFICYP
ncbi:MAG: S8 family serine peptidase, partial [Candidatus Levyibacteriota bacterium]